MIRLYVYVRMICIPYNPVIGTSIPHVFSVGPSVLLSVSFTCILSLSQQ